MDAAPNTIHSNSRQKAIDTGPKLLIVIVNFRTPDLTVDCLRSLEPEVADVPGTLVCVVENGSGDDSGDRIEAAIQDRGWGDWATVLRSDKNWGFAGGNNRGMEQYPDAEFVLMLNSDTVVHRGCLKHCMNVMNDEPTVGAMSCKLVFGDGAMQNVSRRFPTPTRMLLCATGLPWKFPRLFGWANPEDLEWDRETTKRDVDWIGGAFCLIRGEMLRKIGLLDEEFFFEGEDVEFCRRVWRAGFRVHYDPAASITHYAGGSSDPQRMSKQRRNVHRWRARYVYLRKCHGRLSAWLVRGADIVNCGVRIAKCSLFGKRKSQECQDMQFILGLLMHRLEER